MMLATTWFNKPIIWILLGGSGLKLLMMQEMHLSSKITNTSELQENSLLLVDALLIIIMLALAGVGFARRCLRIITGNHFGRK